MVTYSLRITGKVQGVWYRASARDKALSLGLTGRIWNEPNGDVGALVRGPEDKINAFIGWCREGPPLAKVAEVAVKEEPDAGVFMGFEIVKQRV